MKTLYHTIEVSSDELVRFRNISDIHLGNIHCNTRGLETVVSNISNDKNYYWFGGGDYCEFIDAKDRRYRASELDKKLHGQEDIVGTEMSMLEDYIGSISHKCLGFVEGNHEITAARFNNRDIIGGIAGATGINKDLYLGFRGYIVVRFKISGKVRFTLTFFLTHGTGSSRLSSGHVLYLSRFFQNYSADIVMAGHRHVCFAIENSRIVPRGSGTETRIQYAMLSGSFMTEESTGTNYTDMMEYVPTIPGGYEIIVNPHRRIIRLERTEI